MQNRVTMLTFIPIRCHMNKIKLTVDVTLPGMAGGITTDLATIQRNILAIQDAFKQKIYNPGDIGASQVQVVTNVHQFICVINIAMRELTGYMCFINARATEIAALDMFYILCPVEEGFANLKQRFINVYSRIHNNLEVYPPQPVYFMGNKQAVLTELMY